MSGIETAIIAVAAVFVVYLVGVGYGILPAINGNTGNETNETEGWSIGGLFRSSISHAYHSYVDPVAPDFLHTGNTNCVGVDGTFFDATDKVGCFDIPDGNWDARNCLTAQFVVLRQVCDGISGADWICTANDVGCFY